MIKNDTMSKIKFYLNWILGGLFVLLGIIGLFNSFVFGFMFLVIAFILIPTTSSFIEKKTKFKLNALKRIIIIIICFSIGGSFVKNDEQTNFNSKINNKVKDVVIKEEEIGKDEGSNEEKQEVENDKQEQVLNNNQSEFVEEEKEEKKQEQQDYYLVTRVIDGDTIEVNIDGIIEAIRLIGIDTPETKDPRKPVQCFGQEASNKTTEFLLNKKVKLEKDPTQYDRGKYGRLIRYIYTQDNLFFNEWMVENGYAYEYTYGTPYQYQQEFKNAEIYAKNNQLGLWSPNTCNGKIELDSSPAQEQEISEHLWYTSSHYKAQYYYCDTDLDWQGLSESFLKQFNSEEELLNNYDRVLHEPCQ